MTRVVPKEKAPLSLTVRTVVLFFLFLHGVRLVAPVGEAWVHLWGFHFYRFLPVWVSGVCVVLGMGLLAAPVLDRVSWGMDWIGTVVRRSCWLRGLLWGIVLAGAAAFFWQVRVLPLLHDGVALLADVAKPYVQSLWDYPRYRSQEWLSLLLYDYLARYMMDRGEIAAMAYYLVAAGLGVLFVPVCWALAGQFFTDRVSRVYGAMLLGGGISVTVFCGLIEYTTPVFFISGVVCWLGLRYVRTGRGWWWSIALLPVALSLHLESVVLIPGALYILCHRFVSTTHVVRRFLRLEYPRTALGLYVGAMVVIMQFRPFAMLNGFMVS